MKMRKGKIPIRSGFVWGTKADSTRGIKFTGSGEGGYLTVEPLERPDFCDSTIANVDIAIPDLIPKKCAFWVKRSGIHQEI